MSSSLNKSVTGRALLADRRMHLRRRGPFDKEVVDLSAWKASRSVRLAGFTKDESRAADPRHR
jgi:hypothetical protein